MVESLVKKKILEFQAREGQKPLPWFDGKTDLVDPPNN
jgi:hypothetical protein